MRIVLTKGRLETIDYFTECIVKELEIQGIPYYYLDVGDIGNTAEKGLKGFVAMGDAILFTFNNIGVLLSEGGLNFWEKHNIPIYSFLLDHPRNFGDMLNRPIKSYNAICLDRRHIDFIARYYKSVENIFFVPNGGQQEVQWHPFTDRHIDVLCLGDCQPKITQMPVLDFFPDGGLEFYGLCVTMLKENYGLTTEKVLECTIKNYFPDVGDEALQRLNEEIAGYIEAMVRRYFKQKMLRALDAEGVNVEIYGNNWEDEEYSYGTNIHLHPRISSTECNRLMGEARITLNFVPWFKDGSSERPYNSMLNGSVCLIDENAFLMETFEDANDILFFDMNHPEEAVRRIKEMLAEPEYRRLENIAQNGYDKALQTETWANRTRELIHIF